MFAQFNPDEFEFVSPHAPGSESWCDHLSAEVNRLIDLDSVNEYATAERRTHLGVSEIGHPCSRKIWYGFRWVKLQIFAGDMYRLFKRGHDEEPRLIHRLNRIGIHASDIDPATGKQYRITNDFNRHFGGSLDSILTFMWRQFAIPRMIGEYKTHNDNSFKKHLKEGVMGAKPQHYTQMNIYGKRMGIDYGLYVPVNKNNDKIKAQVVRLDHRQADMYEKKADEIIRSNVPPARIAERDTHPECRGCNFRGICHLKQPIEKNCRSCMHATANPAGGWDCAVFAAYGQIPETLIETGCNEHWRPIC